jgi:hypothetical protein
MWISKLGKFHEIAHETPEMVGGLPDGYGSIFCVMARPVAIETVHNPKAEKPLT